VFYIIENDLEQDIDKLFSILVNCIGEPRLV
jgi:hypothetical protein